MHDGIADPVQDALQLRALPAAYHRLGLCVSSCTPISLVAFRACTCLGNERRSELLTLRRVANLPALGTEPPHQGFA